MGATIPFNPMISTNAAGTFSVQSDGYVQGTAQDDPAVRYRLRTGFVADSVVNPMYGGMAVSAAVPPVSPGPNVDLRSPLTLATSVPSSSPALGQISGFTVFDQAHNMIQTPQSPVPSAGTKQTISWYPLGSLARIAVACDPNLASLEGGILTQKVSWDFDAQMLVPYESGSYTVASGTYNSATGVGTVTLTAPPAFSAGDIVLSALTGTGAFASLDGAWPIIGVVGDVVTFQAEAGFGAATISGGTAQSGSGATSVLPVQVLELNIGNSMVVDLVNLENTGFLNWNREGSCALIQI